MERQGPEQGHWWNPKAISSARLNSHPRSCRKQSCGLAGSMVSWKHSSWSLSNSTVPARPCSDLWRTESSYQSVAKSLACNWVHHTWQGTLWPKPWTQGTAAVELRCKIFFTDAAAERTQNLLLFFWVFCINQETPETKQCKITFWTILVHTQKRNSFAVKAKKCLLIMVWEHQQPPAGRGPAQEPGVSLGEPGIATLRGIPAPLSLAPGNHRPKNTEATLKNTASHSTSSFNFFF